MFKSLMYSITLMALFTSVNAKEVELSPKSSIGFEIIKFKISAPVNGKFNQFSGSAMYDAQKMQISNMVATVQVNSIDTDDAKRDGHLKSPDFFAAEKHPTITFKSSGTYDIKDSFSVKGKMTMRGVTKDVLLTFKKVKADAEGFEFKADGIINRLDFGVSWNRALEKSQWKRIFGVFAKTILDDKVKLQLNLKSK